MFQVFQVFKKKNYRFLYFATLTSQMGSVIGMTAFMFYLLARFSEQPYYATITELMYSLPTLVVFFLVGVVADKMDRQKVASYSDWLSAILSIILIVSIYIGWMPLVFIVLFLRSAITKFFAPAEIAIVQGILNKDEYASAAGLNQMTNSIFNLFGGAIGAFIYWTFGVYGAIVIDAISFTLSGLFIKYCSIPEEIRLPNGKNRIRDLKIKEMLVDFKNGCTYVIRFKLLLYLVFGFFVFGILNGAFTVIPAFILKYKLAPETYEQALVIMGIIFGGGVLIGSIIASILASKWKLHILIVTGLIGTGIFVGAIAFIQSLFLFYLFIAFIALFIPLINVAMGGWLPSIVDRKMMGRVQGLISPFMMLSHSATLGFIAILFPSFLSIEGLYLMVGSCSILVGVYYALVLPKYVKQETDHLKVSNEVAETV